MTAPVQAPVDLLPADGPAFPLGVRLLASALVGATAYWGARSSAQLALADWATPAGALLTACGVMVLWCLAWIWRSRTRVDHEGIRQTWLWNKQVRWDRVAQARLIGVPGLCWLLAPRLVVRPRGGGLMVFHSADRRVLAVFASFAATGSPLLHPPVV